jgi:NTE family protein
MADGMRRGLVLGGGGVAGIAWEYGVLAALRDAGIELNDANVVVGTSAGSVVGTALRQGSAQEAYESQLLPVEDEPEGAAGFDVAGFMGVIAAAQQESDEAAARALIGRYALQVPQDQLPEAARIAMIETQLASTAWPDRTLRIPAIDAETGELVVYDAAAGVPLAAAVMASCSVPGVWPTMPVAGRLMTDGGIRSGTNADLASGNDRVLIIACSPEPERSATGPTLVQTAAALASTGSVLVIQADESSVAAFGPNPLLLSTRAGSAAAGFAQGRRMAEEVAALWN